MDFDHASVMPDNNQGQHERSDDFYRRKGLRSYRGSVNEVSVLVG
jgi:hypothetical protein